jgi:hypothetical protein
MQFSESDEKFQDSYLECENSLTDRKYVNLKVRSLSTILSWHYSLVIHYQRLAIEVQKNLRSSNSTYRGVMSGARDVRRGRQREGKSRKIEK